jgi:hypothetical protein
MTTPSPTPEEQAAAHQAEVDAQLAELAATMKKMAEDAAKGGFAIRKGVITDVSDATTPPTVSMTISGDETVITDVRMMNNYSPQVGQTVLVAKQGAEVFAFGAISATNPRLSTTESDNGWKLATLANGTHDGNSNGSIYYRRVLDHGAWKMQWRGGWAPGGATVMVLGLDPDYRPASKRTMTVSRDFSTGATAAQIDFDQNGNATLVGITAAPAATTATGTLNSVDPVDTTSSVTATGTISSTAADGTADAATAGGSISSTTAGGSISTVDPVDTTSSVSVTGTTASVDPGDTTASASISGTTSSVDPSDNTTSAGDPAHTHGVTGSHSHTWSNSHTHGVTGAHSHSFTSSTHSHGVSGGHDHDFTGSSHGHTFTGSSHTHSFTGTTHTHTFTGTAHSHGVTGDHDHTFTGASHSHAVTAPAWVILNGVEYFL